MEQMSEVRGMPQDIYDEIIELIKMEASIQEIAEETGWSSTTIRKIRREAGFRGRVIDPLAHIDTDQVVEDYRVMTNREVMDKHELRAKQLYKILVLVGEPLKSRDPVTNEARELQIAEAVQMYKDGFLLWEINRETGLDQPTLHKHLHLQGVTLRRDQKRSK